MLICQFHKSLYRGDIKRSQNGKFNEGICELFVVVPCDICVSIKILHNKTLLKVGLLHVNYISTKLAKRYSLILL